MQRFRRLLSGFRAWVRHPDVFWVSERAGLRVTIRSQGWLPFAVLFGLLAWYIAAPSLTVAICLAGWVCLVVISYIWSLQLGRRLRGRRVLQYAAMQVGDELEEQVHLSNYSNLPALWVELVDRSDIPGYTVSGARGVGGLSESS